uniref:HIT-type domain-containing protein n=1 Tax=Macrostomum lignano TaxID=282301 RepID=A0A1I8G9G0_9PLAT
LQPAMVDAGVSSRLRETRRLVLDEAARQRRHRRALEALEADNFQADPHADLRVSKLAPKFSDEASSFGPSRDALGGVAASADGKKSRKAKAAGGSGAVGTLGGRLRRNFAALLEEELARRAQLPGASASGSAATPYELAQVGPSRLPPRHFCAVCGLLGPHTCVVCGTRFCSASCYSTHQDTRCLNSPQPTMCSLSRCLHELTSRQPVEEFHQLVSLSTLHTLLTSQPDGSDLTAGQRPISGKQPAVLIDLGDSLRWICGPRTGWLCGCDWRGLRLNLAARLRDFQASLFLPMPLLPGDGGASHCDKLDWAAEQRGRKHRVATIIRYLRELQPAAGAQAQQTWPRPAFSLWLPPPGLVTALRFCLRRLEVPCQQSLDSRLAECARISTNIGCRAIASDSPLCWLLQPPNRSLLLLNSLSPAGGRAFHGYQQLQMRQALLPRLHAASEEERSGLRRQIEAGLAFYGPCCSPATAQDPKSPPAPVDACIEGHKFDPWLVSRAKELHLSGRLHPWVAQVLHYREVRIELGFEDPPQPEAAELDDRLELTVDLFADIRARAYLLLYDIRRAEEDINCSAAAVRETVCRQERGLTTSTVLMTTARFEKGLKQLELPLCAELWGRVGQAGDGVRTTAFLACMHGWRLADPLCAQPLLDPAAVPPGLFLPLS